MGATTTIGAVYNTADLSLIGYLEILPDSFTTRRVMNQPTTISARVRNTANTRSLIQPGRTIALYAQMSGAYGSFNRDMGAGIIDNPAEELLETGADAIPFSGRGMSSLLNKRTRWQPLGAETIHERFVGIATGTATTTASAPAGNGSVTLDSVSLAVTGHVARIPVAGGGTDLVTVTGTFGSAMTFTPNLSAAVSSGVTVTFWDPDSTLLVAPFTRTLAAGAPRNVGGVILDDISGIASGDFISYQMVNGETQITRIGAIEPFGVQDYLENETRPPDDAPTGTTVTVYKAVFDISNPGSIAEGQKIEIALDNATTLTTLVRKVRNSTISLRDYATAGASAGNAATVYDYSEPATDDITQIVAMHSDFAVTIEGGATGTPEGTAKLPRGDYLLQMLTAMAERAGEYWQDWPHTGVPQKRLSWRRTPDATAGGGAPSGIRLTYPSSHAAALAIQNDPYHGIIYSVTEEKQNGLVNRIYPVTADNRINLGYCSTAATDYAASLGFTIVANDDLYIPHYLQDSASVTANGALEVTETVGDISLDDTASAAELEAACDQLLYAAINALLQYQERTFYRIKCEIARPLYPGYAVIVTNDQLEPLINGTYYVLEVTERIAPDGTPQSDVVLSDTLRARRTPANTIARHNQAIQQSHLRSTTRVSAAGSGLIRDSGGGAGVTDHGALTGLADNDHPQYTLATSFTAHAADPAAHHDPVTAANTGITVTDQTVGLRLAGISAIELDNGARLKTTLAGLGLEMPAGTQQLNVKRYSNSGIYADGLGLRLSPANISASTANTLTGAAHTHAVDAATNGKYYPNWLLKADSNGDLFMRYYYADAVYTPSIRGWNEDITLVPGTGYEVKAAGRLRFTNGYRIGTDGSNDLIMDPAGRLILDPVGNVVEVGNATAIQTAGHAGGYLGSGWQMTYAGELDARYIYADEMHVSALIYDAARVAAGRQLTTHSAAQLAEDFIIPAVGASATLTVYDAPGLVDLPVFDDLDWILIQYIDRTGTSFRAGYAYGVVTNYTNLSNDRQSWSFTTRSATVAGQTAAAGGVIHGLGKSGSGWHEVNANGANAPYSTIRVWRGSNPYTAGNIKTVTRHGELAGITGRHEYGIYAGHSDSRHVLLSDRRTEIHGGRLSLYRGDNGRLEIAAVEVEVPTAGTFYRPSSDVSSYNVDSSGGSFYAAIDDDPDAPNLSDYVANEPNAPAELTIRLSGAGTWSGVSLARVSVYGRAFDLINDTIRLTAQVFTSSGAQALTGETTIYTWSSNLAGKFTVDFTDIDTAATSADWSSARLVLRWDTTIAATREAIRLDPATPAIAVGYPLPLGMSEGGAGFWSGWYEDSYRTRIGDPSGASLRWIGSALQIRNAAGSTVINLPTSGGAYFADPIQLATGGGIWQAAGGTFSAPVSGLRIYNDSGRGRLAAYDAAGRAATFGYDGLTIAASGAFAPAGLSEFTYYDPATGKRVGGLDANQNIGGGAGAYTALKLYLNGLSNNELARLSFGYSGIAGASATLAANSTTEIRGGNAAEAIVRLRGYQDIYGTDLAEVAITANELIHYSGSAQWRGYAVVGNAGATNRTSAGDLTVGNDLAVLNGINIGATETYARNRAIGFKERSGDTNTQAGYAFLYVSDVNGKQQLRIKFDNGQTITLAAQT